LESKLQAITPSPESDRGDRNARDLVEVTIRPEESIRGYWLDVWQTREVLCFLTWRQILVRYKQTAIGVLWSVLRPLMLMVVFTLIFGRVAGFAPEGLASYPLIAFTSLVPWYFFAQAVAESSLALVTDASLITKIYFPRVIAPLSRVLAAAFDLSIMLVLLAVLMLLFGQSPGWRVLSLPAVVMFLIFCATAVGMLLAAFCARYRDVTHLVPFITQFGLFASPVFYRSDVVPEPLRLLYFLNPMAGAIEWFRWATLEAPLYWQGLGVSVAVAMLVFMLALNRFRHAERLMADYL
jgi:lipopolysaccharide transport system permease protein